MRSDAPDPDRRPPPRSDDLGPAPGVLDWLLDGDPSIRWRVLRDLVSAAPAEVTAGWGARLLSEQDVDGRWAGALHSPK